MTGGSVVTLGEESLFSVAGSYAVAAFAGGTGNATVTQDGGTVSTAGGDSHALFALAPGSTILGPTATGIASVVQADGAQASAMGFGADGISAGGAAGVNIMIAGLVSGGRDGGSNDFADVGPHGSGIHAAAGSVEFGVIFTPNTEAVTIALADTGSLGALSDQAILIDGGTASITSTTGLSLAPSTRGVEMIRSPTTPLTRGISVTSRQR